MALNFDFERLGASWTILNLDGLESNPFDNNSLEKLSTNHIDKLCETLKIIVLN